MASYRRNHEPRRLIRIIAIAGVVAVAAACAAGGVSAHAGTSPGQLVYICQQAPCPNAQELEVFDGHGAPIFSVGEYGGPAVFGDNLKVFPPASVYRPAVTESWESPAAYDRTFELPRGCAAPSVWFEPGGIWGLRGGPVGSQDPAITCYTCHRKGVLSCENHCFTGIIAD